MHYLAIAIIDSENSSLKEKVDQIFDEAGLVMKQMNKKWKNDSFDQILNDYKNPPREIQLNGALAKHFEERLKKILDKLIDKEFDSYVINDIFSVEKMLKNFENKYFDRYPEAILTPNCEWIKEGWSTNNKEEKRLSEEWNTKFFEILDKYKEKGIVILINCDS